MHTNNQPSETSTNNLLMYSQSVKLEGESTIHNVNTSMMQSELNAKLMEMHALEEQEGVNFKKMRDFEKDAAIFKRFQELQQAISQVALPGFTVLDLSDIGGRAAPAGNRFVSRPDASAFFEQPHQRGLHYKTEFMMEIMFRIKFHLIQLPDRE